MFGLETFHIVFIAVLLAVALVVRFFMNRAVDEARKNGIVDNGLGLDDNFHNYDIHTPNNYTINQLDDLRDPWSLNRLNRD